MTPHPMAEEVERGLAMVPERLREGMRRYMRQGIRPGSFLCSVLANDFIEASCRADPDLLPAFVDLAKFLYNFCPPKSFGSAKRVDKWVAAGGMDGNPEEA